MGIAGLVKKAFIPSGDGAKMLTMRAKAFFFDKKAVRDMVDEKTRSALGRVGAFVRQRARSSMRPGGKKNKISAPGEAPRTHTGELKKKLWFALEPSGKSVVIGPAKFKEGKAPGLLEFGGNVPGRRRGGKSYTAHYKARPYMGPALDKELKNIAPQWGASVKGS